MLTLRRVAKFYGSRLIFKEVGFSVPPGSITLLAGPNGAGKSTLLKIMAGLLRPSAGQVDMDPQIRLGYLGHQTFIYPDLSALENLAFWSRLHGQKPAESRLLAALERVDLAPFAQERAGGFSRGMAQRLNLARVFLLDFNLLLLDEPGTGLDLPSAAILAREIQAARARGAAVVWVSHNLVEDLPRADFAAIIAQRRLLRHGPAAECSANPRDWGGGGQGDSPC